MTKRINKTPTTQAVRLPSDLVETYRKLAYQEGRSITGQLVRVLRPAAEKAKALPAGSV